MGKIGVPEGGGWKIGVPEGGEVPSRKGGGGESSWESDICSGSAPVSLAQCLWKFPGFLRFLE